MQLSKTLLCLLGLGMGFVAAQDDSSCDPQNDDNNDATCTPNNGNAAATSTGNPRLVTYSSTVTDVYTPVATSTDVVLGTSSLPHSLDTRTETILSTSVYSSESVYTTNTLTDAASATGDAGAATTSNPAGRLAGPAGGLGAVLLAVAAAL